MATIPASQIVLPAPVRAVVTALGSHVGAAMRVAGPVHAQLVGLVAQRAGASDWPSPHDACWKACGTQPTSSGPAAGAACTQLASGASGASAAVPAHMPGSALPAGPPQLGVNASINALAPGSAPPPPQLPVTAAPAATATAPAAAPLPAQIPQLLQQLTAAGMDPATLAALTSGTAASNPANMLAVLKQLPPAALAVLLKSTPTSQPAATAAAGASTTTAATRMAGAAPTQAPATRHAAAVRPQVPGPNHVQPTAGLAGSAPAQAQLKARPHFATLVILLPLGCEGGQLQVAHPNSVEAPVQCAPGEWDGSCGGLGSH